MAEMDVFERRVADALAWYADDVVPAVDAAAVARRVAVEHPRRSAGALSRGPIAVPRLAWLLLLAALLAAALVGTLIAGGWRPDNAVVIEPSPSPGATAIPAAIPPELVGTWSSTSANPETAVFPCASGAACGHFERFDGSERCGYLLEYRYRIAEDFIFDSTVTDSFGCAYSPWYFSKVHVTVGPDGTLLISNEIRGNPPYTLHRVPSGPPPPSATPTAAELRLFAAADSVTRLDCLEPDRCADDVTAFAREYTDAWTRPCRNSTGMPSARPCSA